MKIFVKITDHRWLTNKKYDTTYCCSHVLSTLCPKSNWNNTDWLDGKLIERCNVDFNGVQLIAYRHGDNIVIVQPCSDGSDDVTTWERHHPGIKIYEDVEQFVTITQTSEPFTISEWQSVYEYSGGRSDIWGRYGRYVEKDVFDTYTDPLADPFAEDNTAKAFYVPVAVTTGETTVQLITRLQNATTGYHLVREECSGTSIVMSTEFLGMPIAKKFTDITVERKHETRYTFQFKTVHRILNALTDAVDREYVWSVFLNSFKTISIDRLPQESVKALENKRDIRASLERLKTEMPTVYGFFCWLHSEVNRQGTSNNKLLAVFLKQYGNDYDSLSDTLSSFMSTVHMLDCADYDDDKSPPVTRNICLALPGADEQERIRKAKNEWYLHNTLAKQCEGLGVEKEKYPKLWDAITSSNIPIGIFHSPGKPDHAINVEFGLWERALNRQGWAEVIFEITKDAARRSTYDRKITPFLAFLFHIERYLDRNAGDHDSCTGWTAMPRYVESAWDFEMTEDVNENGTVKKRSAFTPIVDNEQRIVTVPYCAVSMSGARTTYCYSEDYVVFEEGLIDEDGHGVVEQDVVSKLNGRDDYGLMYFTLTGTSRNRGYPTFLIIFERRERDNTHVHFHRVHPSRQRGINGTYTPTTRLIEECYRYMAGNVRVNEITAQQGDLIFIKQQQIGDAVKEPRPVNGFENHMFDCVVQLHESNAKSVKNRLGYIVVNEPSFYVNTVYGSDRYEDGFLAVKHPEHKCITLSNGIYEIRRCKSWEANPVSVWSYIID